MGQNVRWGPVMAAGRVGEVGGTPPKSLLRRAHLHPPHPQHSLHPPHLPHLQYSLQPLHSSDPWCPQGPPHHAWLQPQPTEKKERWEEREGKLTRVCLVKAAVGSKWHQEGCPGAGRRGMMLRTRKDAQYWEGCSGSGRMFRSRKDRMDPHFQEGRSVPGRMLRSRKDRTDTQHQEGSSTLLPQPGCLRVPHAGAGTTSLAGFPLP